MRDSLHTVKEVTRAFLGTANLEDEFLLLTVSTNPEPITGFTKDFSSLETKIDSTRSGGATALIDTVYLALSRMRKAGQPRRALLIPSDGMDNHSRYSKSELMRTALEADLQIYAIITDGIPDGTFPVRPAMVRKPWDNGEQNQGRSLLEDLADETGGLHFRVRSEGAGDAAMKAAQAIRSQYVIGYQPDGPGDSGKWHRLRVKLECRTSRCALATAITRDNPEAVSAASRLAGACGQGVTMRWWQRFADHGSWRGLRQLCGGGFLARSESCLSLCAAGLSTPVSRWPAYCSW